MAQAPPEVMAFFVGVGVTIMFFLCLLYIFREPRKKKIIIKDVLYDAMLSVEADNMSLEFNMTDFAPLREWIYRLVQLGARMYWFFRLRNYVPPTTLQRFLDDNWRPISSIGDKYENGKN